MLVAQDDSFFKPISVVQADRSCWDKWLEAGWEAQVVMCGWYDKGEENNHVCLTVKSRYRAAAKRAWTVKSCFFANCSFFHLLGSINPRLLRRSTHDSKTKENIMVETQKQRGKKGLMAVCDSILDMQMISFKKC